MNDKAPVFLVGTRWFGVLGPCKLLIEELNKKGHEIYVFGQKDKHYGQFETDNVRLIRLNMKRKYTSFIYDIIDIVKLFFYVMLKSPASIHSFNPKPSLICYFSLLFSRKTNFFIGVTGLGNTFIKAKYLQPIISMFLSLATKKANYVFFQNTDDIDLFKNKLGVPDNKIMLFQSPGVDTDRFLPKKSYRETNDELKVLLVARLLWQKGVDDFYSTYKKIKSTSLNKFYKFTIVGELDSEHPDRLYEHDIHNIESDGVEWIPWTDRIEDIYIDHDVLLFMSKREGGPRAILEASASGLPTIGSNCTGVRDLILENETGYIVELGDIDEIFNKLEMYRKDNDLIKKHGKNARKLIAEKLSLIEATKKQLIMYKDNE